jgi:hypothetical protein
MKRRLFILFIAVAILLSCFTVKATIAEYFTITWTQEYVCDPNTPDVQHWTIYHATDPNGTFTLIKNVSFPGDQDTYSDSYIGAKDPNTNYGYVYLTCTRTDSKVTGPSNVYAIECIPPPNPPPEITGGECSECEP